MRYCIMAFMNVTSPVRKPRIVLVPHYTGSLRYYEKLGEYLKEHYDVSFLLIQLPRLGRKSYTASHYNFDEMVSRCTEKGLTFYTIRQPAPLPLLARFPFIQFLASARTYARDVSNVLSDTRIRKLIAINDAGFYFGTIFGEAKKRGIKTYVLQWDVTYDVQANGASMKSISAWRRSVHAVRKNIENSIKALMLKFVAGRNARNVKSVPGSNLSDKFGVINQQAFDYFSSLGVQQEKMTVVGYLDFHVTTVLKQRLDTDVSVRADVAHRLGINVSKNNIVIFSSAYNSNVVHVLDDAGQLAFYEEIIEMIRESCPAEHYAISIKIHPIENATLYEPLKQRGVKIYDKFIDNAELIYFSDLYIADSTTVNFVPVLMNKKALFVNFVKLPLIEASREYFGIKKYITDKDEFRALIKAYAGGHLESQYDSDTRIFTKDSLKRIVEWIG